MTDVSRWPVEIRLLVCRTCLDVEQVNMGKKQGRQKHQQKSQRSKASEAKTGKQEAGQEKKARGDEDELSNNVREGTAFQDEFVQLGRVVGLVNLGHTCYFNAALQVSPHADRSFLMRHRGLYKNLYACNFLAPPPLQL